MSIVRKHFQGCVPRWIRNRPTVPVNWKALVQTIECGRSHVNNVAFSDELLASGTGDGNIMLWDISSGALLQTIEGHIRNCTGVAFLDGVLVSVSQDKTIKLWNPTSETLLKAFEIDLDDHSRVAFSKGLLASASSNYPVKVWDINSGVLLRTLEGQSNSDSCLAFSLNGYLARSYQNSIKIWNASSGSLLSMLNCGKNVGEVAISQDGKLLGSAAKEYLFDCTINVWDTSSGVMLRILNGHPYLISALAFSPDSSLLASVSIWGSLKLWESSSGAELLSEEGGERVFDLAFSLDGKLFASVECFSIQLWNANLGAVRGLQAPTLKSHSASITTAAFSPDGRLLASGSVSGAIKLWDTSSGEVLGTFETILVNSLAISPDGRLLASGSAITIKLWNISSGEVLGTFEETSSVNALAFSPDGKLLASGSDKSVKLWDLTSNSDPRTLGVHPWQITQVIFSPDGKLIASGDGFYFKLWDVSSGRVLWTLQPSYHAHGKISFSDDDSILQIDGRSFCVMSGEDSGMNPAKSVTIDREWVVWGKERVLWLPPEYRSHMVEVYRDNIAIYLRSGLAVFIKFAFED
jgi:WD40 repeat protein